MDNSAHTPQPGSETPFRFDDAVQHIKALFEQRRYQESLDICLQITRAHPEIAEAWCNAAVNCVMLARWQDAMGYAQTALARGGNTLALYDALADAHGNLGQWDETRRYGLQALNMRDRLFGGKPDIPPPEPGPMPPLPDAQTREHNVIAFSLFGRNSKYCESAVLNAQEQSHVYPHWVCRFYVDDSVPEDVIDRLRASGAQIVPVQEPARQWPGPMWRLSALQDPQVHRVLFRDADSVISQREAAAVSQWLTSGKRFHMMRDWCSHTELVMAGLWGVVAGSLPPLEQLMARFLKTPLDSQHFADQFFLRQYIWPYARTSLMQHDSIFGFMDAAPFPDVKMPEGFHVGCAEGASFTAKTDLPNGSEVIWRLYLIEKTDDGSPREDLVCSYPGVVKDSAVSAPIPARYAQRIGQKTARVRLFVPEAQREALAKVQSQVEASAKRMRAFQAQGRYQEALDVCLQITGSYPEIAGAWSDAAINCARLGRWQDAIRYAQTALARGDENNNALHDALAHAYGMLGQWDEARRHGLQALDLRARHFSGEPVIPLTHLPPMPPLPSAQTREHNIIAFSLFGHDSKYCETAVLNVQDQPNIYPYWVCRFAVDDSVPEKVLNRLRAGGAQIVPVQGPALQWPGPMWRLLALDDPQAHRILFRDADSLISQREANAVGQWLTSGKRFHMMRDNGACTELMLAGLWGVVAGSLPPLQELVQRFMSVPLESPDFADQRFLQQYIWPYARTSLMQHDSVFGFMDAVPFPDGDRPQGFSVGDAEGMGAFTMKSDQPDGAEVTWALYRIIEKLNNDQVRAELVCSYTNPVRGGVVKVHIPKRYARWLQQGTAQVRRVGKDVA
ncbi:MAG: tetratricopeptide repeat protein [Burkholderiaceae bacterium]|jgi:tetratricopeptide (TPR) repeat protein|nr:tetratricopeptide repeat protein [Burkholderiaceae bacterium]